jgi:hypothetical protein
MADFTSKYGIGQRVEFFISEKRRQCNGTIYSVTFYEENITYGVRESEKMEEHYTIPESYLGAI